MRYIAIHKAKPDMILAKPVFELNGNILLGRNVVLTEDYIQKLYERGFPGVYIQDEISEDIILEETITQELRNTGVNLLKKRDIDGAVQVAKDIVDELLDCDNISLDIQDLRGFDDYTYRHSVNVAVLSTIIGMGMWMTRRELIDLCIGAILHDLGKLEISQEILHKPGQLTNEEFEIMKQHSTLSYELVKNNYGISSTSKNGILFHHENEDGSGYPMGLKNGEIHMYAKIIHVADVYDALTSKRPYKDSYVPAEAVEYLMGNGGILFDLNVVKHFVNYVQIYPRGTEICLSDGREGIVLYNNKENSLRPVVRLFTGEELDLNDGSKYLNLTINPLGHREIAFAEELERRHCAEHRE